MDIKISPGRLSGAIKAPPSKSAAHRAVICAALAKGVSRIGNMGHNDDILATISAMRALGAHIEAGGDGAVVTGIALHPEKAVLDCGESGSTLRFIVPIAAALGVRASFYGRGKLPQRPISPLTEALEQHGVNVFREGDEILTISGRLKSGRYEIAGNISSQYISGLLFALPLLQGDSEVILTTPLESRGYVDITLSALRNFGIDIEATPCGYYVRGGQSYYDCNLDVEGDYSAAAFWLCAGVLNSNVSVSGLAPDSAQGDREIIKALESFGADINESGGTIKVSCSSLHAVRLDVSDIPDLLPILAVAGAYAEGVTELYNAGRLRIKESDRLASVTAGLKAIGADIEEHPESLVIRGKKRLSGGNVDSFGDHRIAMAMSIAALDCERRTIIRGAQCVSKSYPGFYDDFKELGGNCDAVDLG